jgi:hypothetical protein
VFVGEVVIAAGILFGTRLIREPSLEGPRPRLDWVGSALVALGLSVAIMGVLQASNWGWLRPNASPIEPFGLALTPFVIALGLGLLALFASWERRRERRGEDPLVHLGLLRIPMLKGGAAMLIAQNAILMGIFFTIPLYLQIVQGLSALDTGIRMLPASVGLFAAALIGSRLATKFPARPLVRTGLGITFVSTLMLMGTIDPTLDTGPFLLAMGVLGVGVGLVISQLGNVVQSAVTERDRSEAGGIQNTAQQLGSSLGTALLGAVVITMLVASFNQSVVDDPRVPEDVKEQVGIAVSAGASFVSAEQVETAATEEGVEPETVSALVENYEDSQILALKVALLFAGLLVLGSFLFTRDLPTRRFDELQAELDPI